MVFDFLVLSLIIQVIVFGFAFLFKTDKLTDITYALTFFILSVFAFYSNTYSPYKILLLVMITLWSVRLGGFLLIRVLKKGKDKRFDEIRNNFFKFLGFWLLQGLTVWIVLIPSIYFFEKNIVNINFISVLGLVLWVFGLVFESVSDYQKYVFNMNLKNKNKWISKDLWKYSRHPNYFGEIIHWIGVYLFVFPALSFMNKFVGIISPAFITILIIFVSGIPKLEEYADKKWEDNKKYQEYKENTPMLIPNFFKK